MKWKKICNFLDTMTLEKEFLDKTKFIEYGVYPNSINAYDEGWLFIVRDNVENSTKKSLVLYGRNPFYDEFEGDESSINNKPVKVCCLNNKNCEVIMKMFPYTRPSNHRGKKLP